MLQLVSSTKGHDERALSWFHAMGLVLLLRSTFNEMHAIAATAAKALRTSMLRGPRIARKSAS